MRTSIGFLWLFASTFGMTLVSYGGDAPLPTPCVAVADCGIDSECRSTQACRSCCDRGVEFYGDLMFLTRTSGTGTPFVIDVPSLNPRITGSNLDSDVELGFRVGAFLEISECVSWEVSYMRNFWDANARATSPTGAAQISAGPGDAYNWANDISVRYGSDLDNVELNRYRHISNQFSLLAGFRLAMLDESFHLRSVDDNGGGGAGLTAIGDYAIATDNDLYGLQLGAALERECGCRLTLGSVVKAGLFYADKSYSVDFQDAGNFPNPATAFSVQDDSAGFMGEIDLRATYRLNSWLRLRAGFEMLWLEGVALAPAQYQFNYANINANTPLSSGGFFAYGGYCGLEAAW